MLARVPEAGEHLARQVTAVVHGLRDLGLYKTPGVAETIDWTAALRALGVSELDADSAASTIGAVLKYREDAERAVPELASLVEGAGDDE